MVDNNPGVHYLEDMKNAQIYWPDQSDDSCGWVLAYTDDTGIAHERAIDGEQHASVQDLAEILERELVRADMPTGSGAVKVFTGVAETRLIGTITVVDGEVTGWRAV